MEFNKAVALRNGVVFVTLILNYEKNISESAFYFSIKGQPPSSILYLNSNTNCTLLVYVITCNIHLIIKRFALEVDLFSLTLLYYTVN